MVSKKKISCINDEISSSQTFVEAQRLLAFFFLKIGSKQFLCVLHFFCEQFILVSYVL
jgi:hypothetical protein